MKTVICNQFQVDLSFYKDLVRRYMVNLYEVLKKFPGLSRQLTCKDLLFTQYDCPQTTRKERFYLQSNVIIYVISGRRVFHKSKKTWDLREDTCVFLKKGTHVSEREEGEGWCVMTFFIPDHFLKQLINDNERKLQLSSLTEASADHIIPLVVNELSRSFFFSMLPYFTQVPPPPENLLELKFKELVLSLISHQQNRSLLSYLCNLRNDKYPSMEDIVQSNFTFNLTIEQYATLACKSVPTFKREFRKIFQDSPARWVTKKRLNLAKELLENTNLSVAEITFECGFENQTHFSRIFKEKIGMSPLKFRMSLPVRAEASLPGL
jgi:AraC family transcriptional regulator, exoenzyme S synthesis regulatory protein ExsA